jgi:hypothetical protein
MVSHMKTTLVIDDTVLQRLREAAAQQGKTISEMVEAALRLLLQEQASGPAELPPLPVHDLGRAFVDIADRDALYQAMEGR